MTVTSNQRNWCPALLSLVAAGQERIECGDIVRAYDFPGSSDDTFLEGAVTTREDDRILIHVTREVRRGKDEQVGRFEVWAPLGVSMLNGAPCVFLLAK